jgi:hypothetical protein
MQPAFHPNPTADDIGYIEMGAQGKPMPSPEVFEEPWYIPLLDWLAVNAGAVVLTAIAVSAIWWLATRSRTRREW